MTVRFGPGQNTPLTCVWATGFEFDDPDLDGFPGSGLNYTLSNPHQKNGSGGTRCLEPIQLAFRVTRWFPPLREPVIAAAMKVYSHTGNNAEGPYITGDSSSTNLNPFVEHGGQFSLRATRNSTIRFISGGTDLESISPTLTPNQWHWVWWRTFIDPAAGELDVWVDDYNQNVISSTGINTNPNTAENYITYIAMRLYFDHLTGTLDDVAVFARSMYYTGGAGGGGEPVVGNTLANGLGGTAVIDYVLDDGGGTGLVFVSQVSGAFSTTDPLNDGSGWTATASNDLANDEDSLTVPELYFIAGFPTGDGATTDWSSTAGSHYTEVDDTDDATYIHTNTAGLLDELTTSGLLPPKAEPEMLILIGRGRHQGARNVSSYTLAYDDGIGVVPANTFFFTTDHISRQWIWTRNVRTADKFTAAEINALTVQITSVA